MSELIAEILLLLEEFKFWKKKKKYSLEDNTHSKRKIMIRPVIWFTIIMFIFIILLKNILLPLIFSNLGVSKTIDKISEINTILEQQKRDLGKYPSHLEDVIGINPLRKDIDIDAWGNKFYYKLDNGSKYDLKSKGRDGILNTKDDILNNQKK